MNQTQTILTKIWERGTGAYVWRPMQQRGTDPKWIERWALAKAWEYGEPGMALDLTQPWNHDLYFTPLTFTTEHKRGKDVAGGHVLFADLDGAHPDEIPITPSIAWETSPGMYQGVWFTSTYLGHTVQQDINRRLTYHVGADKGGWQTSKVLRVPNTLNFKRQAHDSLGVFVPAGKVLYVTDKEYDWFALDRELPPVGGVVGDSDYHKIRVLVPEDPGNVLTMNLPMRLRAWLTQEQVDDRSIHIWKCAQAFAQIGWSQKTAYDILYHRPWNKYKDRPEVLWRTIQQAYEGN